jgi:sulfite reductase (ferredoxin)
MPGGVMTADQYLAMDDICERHANGTLRFTTRQSIQLHGVLKKNLKQTIADINATLLSTISACGDVNRNVLACPAPLPDAVRKLNNELCFKVADHLTPHAGKQAYHEIWLNGESVTPAAEPEVAEPIYGKLYLPRKFKTAFGQPDDNCVDIYANCLGFQAIAEKGQPVGYNLLVGGGMGMTNSKPETFPHLAKEVCYLEPDQVVAAAEAVVKLYRDHGNRSDRKRARIKYLMADWGVEKFREVFQRDYFKTPLVAAKHAPVTGVDLHLGWHSQGGDKWFYGVSVENGRVKDEGDMRLRTGLREVVRQTKCSVGVTAQQDVLLRDIPTAQKATVDKILAEHGVAKPEAVSQVQKWSMACPAIPTCPLAISESERFLPTLVDEFEKDLAEMGLGDAAFSVRMTGCPNGCARPYNSDVGIVGRSGDKYTLYVGGRIEGDRLSYELQDLVPKDQLLPRLKKVLAVYKADRTPGEGFGDFVTRIGKDAVLAVIGA